MANEVQRLTPAASPTLLEDGALELTFDGQTTASISHGDINTTATFASKIQTELEALSNIGSGNVAVTWSTDHARVEFQGTLANTNVAEITVSANTLKRAADTVSVTTTTNGAAEIDDLTGTGGSFSDGNDTDTAAVQTITFSNDPNDGNWFFDGGLVTYPSAPSRSGWTTTGDYVDGFTITKDDFASGQSPVSVTGGTLRYYVAGVAQVVTVTLPDSPTEGTLNVTLDGSTSSDFNYNDSSPASISGWTGGGSAGNWTYTRDTAASNVSVSGAEGSTPLRKAFTITPSTETQGSGGGIAAESPVALLDFMGIAPVSAKIASSGQGLLDFLGVAPTSVLTAASGQGLIDFAHVQPASSKLSAQPAAALDFSAPAMTEIITAPSPVVIVDITPVQPISSKVAALPVALLNISAIAPGSSHSVSLDTALLDLTSVAATTTKAAGIDPALLDITAPALTESLVGVSGQGLIDFSGVAPIAVHTVESGVALLCFASVTPATTKSASLPTAVVEFAAPTAIATYGSFTIIAAHFYVLDPAAIDSLDLGQAGQAMSLDPLRSAVFTLDTHITQAFSGDTRRVDAP